MSAHKNSSSQLVPDQRRDELQAWYEGLSDDRIGAPRAVAGDASFRRYYRAAGEAGTVVLCDAPPETEKNREFVSIARGLQALGVRVPRILHFDLERGFLALEDLGDQTLLPLLDDASVDAYYRRAMQMLERLALGTMPGLGNYEHAMLAGEMALFPEWFCDGLLKLTLDSRAQQSFAALQQTLCARALDQPQVIVHRDFHARNLMLPDSGELAAIDFQDAVRGPLTYDLVSLLKDCYVRWSEERVRGWALAHRERLLERGLSVAGPADFLRDFDYMGLQRHIKVLGIFARLSCRDGKHGYLADLPRVLRYVQDVLERYPDDPVLTDFSGWLNDRLLPVARQQSWFSERV